MSTIAPSRLNDVSNAAQFMSLTADNFTILAEDTAQRVATYQNGTPTTIIGPPTSGSRVLNEFWRDALKGEWVCTTAGTPGTWLQYRPAPVSSDPTTGTIPVGYLIWNMTQGNIKRHQGGYVWAQVVGDAATSLLAFHGATAVAQRANANQAAAVYNSQTISAVPTQAEVQAINDGLVSVRTLVNELRAALVEKGLIKGSA